MQADNEETKAPLNDRKKVVKGGKARVERGIDDGGWPLPRGRAGLTHRWVRGNSC
jgi:hypothetical protein